MLEVVPLPNLLSPRNTLQPKSSHQQDHLVCLKLQVFFSPARLRLKYAAFHKRLHTMASVGVQKQTFVPLSNSFLQTYRRRSSCHSQSIRNLRSHCCAQVFFFWFPLSPLDALSMESFDILNKIFGSFTSWAFLSEWLRSRRHQQRKFWKIARLQDSSMTA